MNFRVRMVTGAEASCEGEEEVVGIVESSRRGLRRMKWCRQEVEEKVQRQQDEVVVRED